jgi:hypothetical protein
MTLENFVSKVDYVLLAKQKGTLINILESNDQTSSHDHIEGLIEFLDGFQDAAVDSGQVPEETVFPNVMDRYLEKARIECAARNISSSHVIDICSSVMMTRDGILHGGSFVQAVVDNDLVKALAYADIECRDNLLTIAVARENWHID